jgi:mRNA-degrading endonuclease RelE of RelBE toxin-antitoxin system
MNFEIIAIDSFKRAAKKLLKKYNSLKSELLELQEQLKENPRMGVCILENIYKIRLAVKSKGKGKSGGMRVITYVVELELQVEENTTEQKNTIFLLTIYDKSEMENIDDSEIYTLIGEAQFESSEEETNEEEQ